MYVYTCWRSERLPPSIAFIGHTQPQYSRQVAENLITHVVLHPYFTPPGQHFTHAFCLYRPQQPAIIACVIVIKLTTSSSNSSLQGPVSIHILHAIQLAPLLRGVNTTPESCLNTRSS
jgi:hypothetical protein